MGVIMSSIDLTKIPVNIVKTLKKAGIDPKSDGREEDISLLDIKNAECKLWNNLPLPNEPQYEKMKEKIPDSCEKLKYALSALFTYLHDNGKGSVANDLQKEIYTMSPILGTSIKNEDQLKEIHGRQVLAEKGIMLSVHPDIPCKDIIQNKLNFGKKGNDIELTYYDCKKKKFIEPKPLIDTRGLKEIRLERIKYGTIVLFGVIPNWKYRIKAIYDYKDVGEKERIVAETKYNIFLP